MTTSATNILCSLQFRGDQHKHKGDYNQIFCVSLADNQRQTVESLKHSNL